LLWRPLDAWFEKALGRGCIGLENRRLELLRHLAQFNAVLRALRARQAGRYVAQVQLDHLRIVNLRPASGTPNRPCALK
jgi:hypothetical protein